MIIPIHRVMTTQYPIDATTTIEAGMVVSLTSAGKAQKCALAGAPVGIAADRNRASEAYEYENRVSDNGNETRGSGMLSVYSLGEFWVDMDDSNITTPAGSAITGVVVSTSSTTPGDPLYTAAGGQMDDTSTGATLVGRVLVGAASLNSGIPGEFEPNSVEMAVDGTPRTWVKIKLVV